jgi:hypothetical protein
VDKTLRWTSDAMERWYGQPRVALSADQERVSSMVLMALSGDAGQRAIALEAMRWPPAQQASGTAWMAPQLIQLLDDPYDAVRYGAGRALRSVPGFSTFTTDFIAGTRTRRQVQLAAMRQWDGSRGADRAAFGASVLLGPDGSLLVDEMLRLIRQRSQRRMLLRE